MISPIAPPSELGTRRFEACTEPTNHLPSAPPPPVFPETIGGANSPSASRLEEVSLPGDFSATMRQPPTAASGPAEDPSPGLAAGPTILLEGGEDDGPRRRHGDRQPPDDSTRRPTSLAVLRELVKGRQASPSQTLDLDGCRCTLFGDGVIEHHCAAWLPPSVVIPKLDGFVRDWKADILGRQENGVTLRIACPHTLWQRIRGWPGALRLELRWDATVGVGQKLSPLTARLECAGGTRRNARTTLLEAAPRIFGSLRRHLLAPPEKRGQDRVSFPVPLQLLPRAPVHPANAPATPCVGVDISPTGIGFLSPFPPSDSE